jgi:hypothetical protein
VGDDKLVILTFVHEPMDRAMEPLSCRRGTFDAEYDLVRVAEEAGHVAAEYVGIGGPVADKTVMLFKALANLDGDAQARGQNLAGFDCLALRTRNDTPRGQRRQLPGEKFYRSAGLRCERPLGGRPIQDHEGLSVSNEM